MAVVVPRAAVDAKPVGLAKVAPAMLQPDKAAVISFMLQLWPLRRNPNKEVFLATVDF